MEGIGESSETPGSDPASSNCPTKKVEPAPLVIYRKKLWQRKFLLRTFRDLHRPITNELREECIEKTGLKWSKIYKWLFDKRAT